MGSHRIRRVTISESMTIISTYQNKIFSLKFYRIQTTRTQKIILIPKRFYDQKDILNHTNRKSSIAPNSCFLLVHQHSLELFKFGSPYVKYAWWHWLKGSVQLHQPKEILFRQAFLLNKFVHHSIHQLSILLQYLLPKAEYYDKSYSLIQTAIKC